MGLSEFVGLFPIIECDSSIRSNEQTSNVFLVSLFLESIFAAATINLT